MPLNGTCLARARERLEQLREEHEATRKNRVTEVFFRLPKVQEIDQRLQRQMVKVFGLTLHYGQDPTEELRQLQQSNLALQAERAKILTDAGFPADYTEPICSCKVCGDKGYLPDGSMCDCLLKLYNQELTRDLSTLLQTGSEQFEKFDLSYYDEPARSQMARVLEICRSFAEGFAPEAPNLLLQGETGLGKTFLSACIARTVAEQGYTVAYESAGTALGFFETAKFQRNSELGEQAGAKVEQYLSCDLMILDDLGTEMISPYSTSALYSLINTRMVREKTTIISTNLDDAALHRCYTPQILSRLEGCYITLGFVGRDIRQVRKERGIL